MLKSFSGFSNAAKSLLDDVCTALRVIQFAPNPCCLLTDFCCHNLHLAHHLIWPILFSKSQLVCLIILAKWRDKKKTLHDRCMDALSIQYQTNDHSTIPQVTINSIPLQVHTHIQSVCYLLTISNVKTILKHKKHTAPSKIASHCIFHFLRFPEHSGSNYLFQPSRRDPSPCFHQAVI